MILLLSYKAIQEESTVQVMDWLAYKNADFVKVNGEDLGQGYTFTLNNAQETVEVSNLEDTALEDIHVVWYRRWRTADKKVFKMSDVIQAQKLNDFIHFERKHADYTFLRHFKKAHWVSDRDASLFSDKIEMLRLAKQAGLEIPPTMVTDNKQALQLFLHQQKRVITKCLRHLDIFQGQDKQPYTLYTNEVEESLLDSLPDTFLPSFFQKMIDKEVELRIFYLKPTFYAMAIFSQLDQQTEVDFRRYNWEKPNRWVPFCLPTELEEKLQNLMAALQLESGSIDIIKTPDNRYIFLEVNPVGQFGMISQPCNYFLEEKVAEYLINKDLEQQASQ